MVCVVCTVFVVVLLAFDPILRLIQIMDIFADEDRDGAYAASQCHDKAATALTRLKAKVCSRSPESYFVLVLCVCYFDGLEQKHTFVSYHDLRLAAIVARPAGTQCPWSGGCCSLP